MEESVKIVIVIGAAWGVLVAVVSYLLIGKDKQQGDFIKDLYVKHEADAERLDELDKRVIGRYYEKRETDEHLKQVHDAVVSRLDRIESRMDGLDQLKTILMRMEKTLDSTLK